jgi:hypothetical protein
VDPAFIRTKGFAAYIGVSQSKAHEIVMSGRVKSVWLDGVRLIPVEEARAFADRLKSNTGLVSVA